MNFLGNKNASGGASVIVPIAASGGDVVNAGKSSMFSLTPTANETLTASVAPAGFEVFITVLTAGTSSYTITFGTGFRATGTLATGTADAKKFVLHFISDGATMNEVARTTAL